MTSIKDFALPDRQLFVAGVTTAQTMRNKRLAAIEWMGEKYVLHVSNRVKRLEEPLPEVFAWKPAKVLKTRRKS